MKVHRSFGPWDTLCETSTRSPVSLVRLTRFKKKVTCKKCLKLMRTK